jgi:hypothetical protein
LKFQYPHGAAKQVRARQLEQVLAYLKDVWIGWVSVSRSAEASYRRVEADGPNRVLLRGSGSDRSRCLHGRMALVGHIEKSRRR